MSMINDDASKNANLVMDLGFEQDDSFMPLAAKLRPRSLSEYEGQEHEVEYTQKRKSGVINTPLLINKIMLIFIFLPNLIDF